MTLKFGTQIFKEQLGRCPKTKNPETFIIGVLGNKVQFTLYFPKPPVSYSIASVAGDPLNCERDVFQLPHNGRCLFIVLDMFNVFIIVEIILQPLIKVKRYF